LTIEYPGVDGHVVDGSMQMQLFTVGEVVLWYVQHLPTTGRGVGVGVGEGYI